MNEPDNVSTLYPGGEAQYSFRMFAVYDQPIVCTTTDPRIVECTFSKVDTADPLDANWHLTIRLGPVHSIDEVKEICDATASQIFDRVSLAFQIKIDQIRMIAHSLMALPGGGCTVDFIIPMMTLDMEGRVGGRKLLAGDVQVLQAALTNSEPFPSPTLVALYRSALCADDPIAKFLMLYLILYELSGNEEQKKVDCVVLKYFRQTVQAKSSRIGKNGVKKTKKETIYTRLRNQVTHRIEAAPEQNRREIVSNLDTFESIVRHVLTSENEGGQVDVETR